MRKTQAGLGHVPGPPLAGCVALGKPLGFSGPQVPYLGTGNHSITDSWGVVGVQRGTTPWHARSPPWMGGCGGLGTRRASGRDSLCLSCPPCLVMGTVTWT